MKKIILLIFIILFIWNDQAIAMSLTVAPGTITMDNASRGKEYVNTFMLKGDLGEYSINSTGEMSGWNSYFEPENPNNPISHILIKDQEYKKLLLRTKVPDDAANGDYQSALIVQSSSSNETGSGSGSSLKLSMSIDLKLTVKGEQKLSGKVKSISVRSAEENSSARVKVTFENTGNVVANPHINADIYKYERDKERYIESVSFSGAIKPGKTEVINGSWDSKRESIGNYFADVKISLEGEEISSEKINFKVVPVGSVIEEEENKSTPGFEVIYTIIILLIYIIYRGRR